MGQSRYDGEDSIKSGEGCVAQWAPFRCISCGSSRISAEGCDDCEFQAGGEGIIDFVQGSAATQLDSIDYDAHYAVSEERSDKNFLPLAKTFASLDGSYDNVLEVGCGTGGFTIGFLRALNPGRVVLTDVSPKMLAQCRSHLCRLELLDDRDVRFATFSGTEDCFSSEAFDCCMGSFVVHHVLEVSLLLKRIADALKPGGTALFIEPNWRFHTALVQILGDVVVALRQRGATPVVVLPVLNWVAEIRYNLVHGGNADLMGCREDKHLFREEEIRLTASEAGLSLVEMGPYGDPMGVYGALPEYLQQMGLIAEDREMVMALAASIAPRYTDLLAPADRAPASVIVLRKCRSATSTNEVAFASSQVAAPLDPPMRSHLVVKWANRELIIEGWVCSPIPIREFRITAGDHVFAGAVWRPRVDVYDGVNMNRDYPAVNALCSGVQERFPCDVELEGIVVDLVTTEGHRVTRQQRMEDGAAEFHF